MKLYVGCGLTHVPRTDFAAYVQFVHSLVAVLEGMGHSVTYALRDSDPQLGEKPFDERARLCYLWDRGMVEDADVLVADASYPSIGLGIELQVAESRDIPVVLSFLRSPKTRVAPIEYVNPDLSHHSLQIGDGYVSLIALGVPSIFRLVPYGSAMEGIQGVATAVELLERKGR
jgi:hypothetical protein